MRQRETAGLLHLVRCCHIAISNHQINRLLLIWCLMLLPLTRCLFYVILGHAFNVHDRCVAAGYDNGDIKLFDLRKMALRWETNLKNGVVGIEFDRKDIDMNKLVATTLESKFHVFDLRTQHPTKGFTSLVEKVSCPNAAALMLSATTMSSLHNHHLFVRPINLLSGV